MKPVLLLAIATMTVFVASAQQPSPPAEVKETLNNGTVITINYGQPSVRNRTIGKDLEPMDGKVWRAGANKATVFEASKDVKINGQSLPAGKYGFFTLSNGDEWTLIFSKTWDQWGAFKYDETADALRVKVKASKPSAFSEKLTYTIAKNGEVALLWGDKKVDFKVE